MSVSRRTLLQGTLLSAAGLLHAPSRALAEGPDAPPTSDQRGQMATLATDFMGQYDVPGLSIALAIRGKPVYVEAFGVADRETGEALTPQHRFRIASISKPVSSTGIFTLVEAGKARLGDYVFGPNSILGADYPTTPTLQSLTTGGARSNVEQITIEHLLTHTTGAWGNQSRDPMFMNQGMTHRELIKWTLAQMPLTEPPGGAYAYSNFGYCILGRVIEKLTGQRYEQYIKDAVLKRCGITDMQIAGNTLSERASREVKYYCQTGNPYQINVARMDSHGGWIATPSDLTTLFIHIDGFKDTAQLLSDDSLRVMSTPSTANPRYAKGLFITANNNWWHSGLLDGTTTITVRTNGDFCWSAFTNTRSRDAGMTRALDLLVWRMTKVVPDWHPQTRG